MEKAIYVKIVENRWRVDDFKEERLPSIEGIVTSSNLQSEDPTGCNSALTTPKLTLYLDQPFKPIQVCELVRIDVGEKVRVFYEDHKKEHYISAGAIEVFDKKGKVKFRYHEWYCAFIDE